MGPVFACGDGAIPPNGNLVCVLPPGPAPASEGGGTETGGGATGSETGGGATGTETGGGVVVTGGSTETGEGTVVGGGIGDVLSLKLPPNSGVGSGFIPIISGVTTLSSNHDG